MIKSTLLVILLLCSSVLLAADERKIVVETKMQRVIVFLNGAQIERSAQAAVPSGISEVVFKGLSSQIEEQSIQVKGTGKFTILSVNKQTDFLQAQQLSETLSKMRDRISELSDEREIQQNSIAILKKEEDMLASNQNVGNGGAGLDLNKLKQALDFQKARLNENKVKQLSSLKEIARLDAQIKKMQNQLEEESGKPQNKTSNIVVKVSASAAVSGSFTVTYLVKSASWYPSYDIRASDVNKPVDLIYRANISQQSGEDWKNVRLVLSSGDPSMGGAKPTLLPYQIGYNVSRISSAANITSVKGRVADEKDNTALAGVSVRVKGTSIGTTSDANGNYTIQVPSSNSVLQFAYIGYETQELTARTEQLNVQLTSSNLQLNEVVVVGYGNQAKQQLVGRLPGVSIRGTSTLTKTSLPLEVEVQQHQTNVQFEVAQPYSITSDGKLLTVEIAEHQLEAEYRYYAVPKLSQEAYLTASVTGITELNLLSGEASLFFDGAYLGKTLLNTANTDDSLSLSLGVDKNVIVKRVQQREQNERSVIGSSQRASRAFQIEVLNRKAQPIHLVLEDQIPVSNTGDVTVEAKELSGAKLDEATGILKWDLKLQPQEKKITKLQYQVKYPKNRPLILE